MYDAIVIGAGAVGCSIARALSRYNGKFAVLEKCDDVCDGTSKANSAISHAGFDAKPGTNKAKMNILGNKMMPALAKELDFPYFQNGSLVVCTAEQSTDDLKELYNRGIANGVENMEIISGQRLRDMEPNLSDNVVAALYAPTAGIVCPFQLTIGMAENACTNGVSFYLNTKVQRIVKKDNSFDLYTDKDVFSTRTVINAAGLYTDFIHNMLCSKKIKIIPRKGEYFLLDHLAGEHVSHTVFQLPTRMGKGVLVSPTVHGNLIVGPTASEIEDRDATDTTQKGMDSIRRQCGVGVKNVPLNCTITSFAGVRAHEEGDDFILGETSDCPGLFDAAGIESPGLTSAPAIGELLAGQVADKLNLKKNPNFNPRRKGIVKPGSLSPAEYNALIAKDPAYGRMVCRCEQITEGEIRDAIRRPLGARTLDAVKRRTRAGMGRCQSGFCSPRVMEILAEEWKVDRTQITKDGGQSNFLTGVLRSHKKGEDQA